VLSFVIRHRDARRGIDGDHRRLTSARRERTCRGTMKVGKKSVTTRAALSRAGPVPRGLNGGTGNGVPVPFPGCCSSRPPRTSSPLAKY
jgi:hypothetical protein